MPVTGILIPCVSPKLSAPNTLRDIVSNSDKEYSRCVMIKRGAYWIKALATLRHNSWWYPCGSQITKSPKIKPDDFLWAVYFIWWLWACGGCIFWTIFNDLRSGRRNMESGTCHHHLIIYSLSQQCTSSVYLLLQKKDGWLEMQQIRYEGQDWVTT